MAVAEMPLPGGHRDRPVRVGAQVLRPARPWSKTVQSLLSHLHAVGWTHAPVPLGFDEHGREALRYVEGNAAAGSPLPDDTWSDGTLTALGRLLRGLHDATTSFVVPRDAMWNPGHQSPSRDEVICHNDLGPWNVVFRNGLPAAFIDWDSAAPGTRLWDLAGAAWHWVPLWEDGRCLDHGFRDLTRRVHRLRLLAVDGYGLPTERLSELIETVLQRQQGWIDFLTRTASAGDEASRALIDAGSVAGTRDDMLVAEQVLHQARQHYG